MKDILPAEPASLATSRMLAKRNVLKLTANARAKVTEHADPYKMTAWLDKALRAQRVLSDLASKADSIVIQTECDKRDKGETPQVLAQKQLAKAEKLACAVAVIDGMESVALDAIDTEPTLDELAALLNTFEQQITTQVSALIN